MTQAPHRPAHENAMIVEDERDLSYLLSVVLKQNHVPSACAYSLKEAKEVVKKLKPSMIFLDNHLPDGTGTDFIRQVKSISPGTKIIMITAHDSATEIDEAFHKGADYFISKPFSSSTIRKTLDFFITNKDG